MEYLTRWRMLIATDRLANQHVPIATIAAALGYESESAFGVAFKRVIGSSPRQVSRTHRRSPAEIETPGGLRQPA